MSVLDALQGLMPNYVKVVPSIAIAFVSYEQVPFLRDLVLVLTLHCLAFVSYEPVSCPYSSLSSALLAARLLPFLPISHQVLFLLLLFCGAAVMLMPFTAC